MSFDSSINLDVAVVGGGPAGITACLELRKSSDLRVALFECDRHLGGMPRSCHVFFGMRDQKRIRTGPTYARRLGKLMQGTGYDIHRSARVLDIFPGNKGESHLIRVLSPKGLREYACRSLLLATGCFESPRAARQIPGSRPSGILTTGTLQQLVNLRRHKPGKQALIIGSENIAFSSVLTLRRAGTSIAGIVEQGTHLQTHTFPARAMSAFYGFPIFKGTSVVKIHGNARVEAVELKRKRDGTCWRVECDTVVMTGKFRPDSALLENTSIEMDPGSRGPVVDMNLMTSIRNIFAAGNILRGADMHDLCALEGRLAARGILNQSGSAGNREDQWVRLHAESPVRYVVPQRIRPALVRKGILLKPLLPWPSIQMERTLRWPVLEAWSGKKRIWRGSYRKLIANTRIPLPVEKFDWDGVDLEKGVLLKTIDKMI